ncbi:RNA polymerase I-specific transcription initiation factor-domain-containing protein [Amylocarpus encephaloides]|uniref:RNA polymerase I-specific transcription initiation factor-domain-containing protein n=1 Tax=Amylocarpus encephaloides TaxID=45428 RepID=A0A9P7YB98_9HELO|nr:RNA polymerase I-specific transcription initiation factor-domain-containing protein [Amylocarpus encephaloides]
MNNGSWDSSDSGNTDLPRPNIWNGPNSTWYSHTEEERGLAASLDGLRNQDLGVHLYNAHALKRRADELKGKTTEGIPIDNPVDQEDAEDPFVPNKRWTAWPLPPHLVPREDEKVGEDDPDDIYTFKRQRVEHPSRVLEEVLTGVALKFAKETFAAREWATPPGEDLDVRRSQSRATSPRKSREYQESDEDDREVFGAKDEDDPSIVREPDVSESSLRPIFSADDENSARLLRPTIRNALSKLDEVLMALHYARKTCHEASKSADGKITSDGDSSRQFQNLAHRTKRSHDQAGEGINDAKHPRKKPTGRPKKVHPRLNGETEEEYLVRIARIRRVRVPKFASIAVEDSPISRSPLGQATRAPKEQKQPKSKKSSTEEFLRPRDWSEVLGSATLVGIPPDIIARATQRCANIFGEGMVMRTLPETPFEGQHADTLTAYQPKEITCFVSEIGEEGDSSRSSQESEESGQETNARVIWHNISEPKAQVCFCPIQMCPRQATGFSSPSRLRQHMEKSHQLTEAEIAGYGKSDAEGHTMEVDGAIHIDGYLKTATLEKRRSLGKSSKREERYRRID